MNYLTKKFYTDVEDRIVGQKNKASVGSISGRSSIFVFSSCVGVNYSLKIICNGLIGNTANQVQIIIRIDSLPKTSRNFDLKIQYDEAFEYYKSLYKQYISISDIRDRKFGRL